MTPGWSFRQGLAGWLPTVLLLGITASVGPMIGAPARPIFLIGCLLVSAHAWIRSPGCHLQVALTLFTFTPLLRRLVDVSAGFDPSGLMVSGPLLALLAPLPDIVARVTQRDRIDGHLAPVFVVAACTVYCALLTVAIGEWGQAAGATLKWMAPLFYCVALVLTRPNVGGLLRDATAAFAILLPMTGLYGVFQFVDPPVWDRYWLAMAAITSAGLPEPYAVRTFSTMHSPASFATFSAIGLLLVFFLRKDWASRIAMLPTGLALMLSLYRTAWISLAAGLVFCLFFPVTRSKAMTTLAAGGAAVTMAALLTPFGDVIGERLSTFGNASNDGSGQERLEQFATLWRKPFANIFGVGFTVVDTNVAGAAPLDGMIAICWSSMGIVVGLVCLAAILAAIAKSMAVAVRIGDREAVILGALGAGWLTQLPLAAITIAELGFVFWTSVALALLKLREGRKWACEKR